MGHALSLERAHPPSAGGQLRTPVTHRRDEHLHLVQFQQLEHYAAGLLRHTATAGWGGGRALSGRPVRPRATPPALSATQSRRAACHPSCAALRAPVSDGARQIRPHPQGTCRHMQPITLRSPTHKTEGIPGSGWSCGLLMIINCSYTSSNTMAARAPASSACRTCAYERVCACQCPRAGNSCCCGKALPCTAYWAERGAVGRLP